MKQTTLPFLFLSLLALSLVVAEDRTSDPNDPKFESPLTGIDSDGSWQVNLPQKDTLTGEDFNVDIKVEPLPQEDNNFDDYQDPDVDSIDDDGNIQDHPGLDQTADADFDLDLIRREIIGEAHKNVMKGRVEVQAIDDDDDDTDDYDYNYVDNARDETEPEKSVDSVDDDLRPDNGKISTQVSGNDYDDEVEDSDDGDDADIIDSNDDSDDDEKIDLDYQQDDDSAMADDDYINDSNIQEVVDDNDDYTVDYNDDDSGDSDTDDDFLSKDYLKFVALDVANLNLTTIDIAADGSNSKAEMSGIYYQADDDQDSDSGYDDDSDSDYDIYDTTYQEEPERGNLSSDDSQDSSYDYDIFLDIDDSVWASYLTNDDDEAGNL